MEKSFQFECGDILNIDKPTGITSFQAVRLIRKWTKCKKVGHAGTLDPMATGVLIVCTGKATKQVSSLMNMEKVYEGTICLGKTTDTDDAEGKVLSENTVPVLTRSEIEDILSEYCGEIDQVPPKFSAIRKNGVRLYKMARKGIPVDIGHRKVLVYKIELLSWKTPNIRLRITCGKGTYIRALARDIGSQLGCGGYLSSLRRIRVGEYHVHNAWQLDQFKELIIEHENISHN